MSHSSHQLLPSPSHTRSPHYIHYLQVTATHPPILLLAPLNTQFSLHFNQSAKKCTKTPHKNATLLYHHYRSETHRISKRTNFDFWVLLFNLLGHRKTIHFFQFVTEPLFVEKWGLVVAKPLLRAVRHLLLRAVYEKVDPNGIEVFLLIVLEQLLDLVTVIMMTR